MSRAYNARRKAKRQALAAAERTREQPTSSRRRRLTTLAPVLLIVAIFAAVGILGFGLNAETSKARIEQEVTELLDGIPQRGEVLGSPKAPVTVWMYADLECPTVKLFVEHSLPAIIENWVRPGAVRLDYRSLETDTANEEVFFDQETAALAAGRQDRMWNFALAFVRQQGEPRTDYADEEFLAGIASQVPGLELARWDRDRDDALLSRRVALGVYSGHSSGLRSTPSFLIGFTEGAVDRREDRAAIREEIEAALGREINFLRKEANGDLPTLKDRRPDAKEAGKEREASADNR
jgi:protein-disulfide isomerase